MLGLDPQLTGGHQVGLGVWFAVQVGLGRVDHFESIGDPECLERCVDESLIRRRAQRNSQAALGDQIEGVQHTRERLGDMGQFDHSIDHLGRHLVGGGSVAPRMPLEPSLGDVAHPHAHRGVEVFVGQRQSELVGDLTFGDSPSRLGLGQETVHVEERCGECPSSHRRRIWAAPQAQSHAAVGRFTAMVRFRAPWHVAGSWRPHWA